jgi:ATP-dependent DNA helicase RecG
MKLLLQGEVGSGKTVVALSAVLLAVENSHMGVVIAPTEILAEQHYMTFKSYLEDLGVSIELVIGNMKKSERKKILANAALGKTDIIVGTHALLQDDVDLKHAKIAVIDEQHRFGVRQRANLTSKSSYMDVLAMSATPIPRTLSMSVYGDLDVSTIKTLPKNRKKPVTKYVREHYAYDFALKEVKAGHSVYIVHPLVEESDVSELKSAQKRFNELRKTVFKGCRCGLLHGRMNREEKEDVMRNFAKGEFQILFTTTVVEVGINVLDATVMIIEHFNRYGLATLHQLRGRIARSHHQPYCFLTGNITTAESKKRLEIITNSDDGFEIAEEDLRLRGGGELFGTKQHGIISFKIGDPINDIQFLKKAREYAFYVIKNDMELRKNSNKKLKDAVFKEYGKKFHLAYVS